MNDVCGACALPLLRGFTAGVADAFACHPVDVVKTQAHVPIHGSRVYQLDDVETGEVRASLQCPIEVVVIDNDLGNLEARPFCKALSDAAVSGSSRRLDRVL